LLASESLRKEVISYFMDHFGVPKEVLLPLTFAERNNEVWATSVSASPHLATIRMAGLRCLRRTPQGFKPTSVFLRVIGCHIVFSRVEIAHHGLLQHLLLGQSLHTLLADGFVAVSFHGDVLGCGVVRRGELRALLPTQRRRELLNALNFTLTTPDLPPPSGSVI